METKPQIQFQRGKWYKSQGINNFAKCLRYEDDIMYASERKITDYQNLGEYPFCDGYTWIEATQEELKEFLPEGHPDLIQNSSTMEKDISEAKFKIGEVVNTTDKGWQYCTIEGINSMSYSKSTTLSNVTITEIRFSIMHQNFWYTLDDYGNWFSECALEPIEVKKVEETTTPKFKPGDKVEFISSSSTNAEFFKKGHVNLIIHSVERIETPIRYNVWENDKSTTWIVYEDELQLMSSSETVIPQEGIDMFDIQRECKEKYPIGAIVKNTEGKEHCITEDEELYRIVENYIYSSFLQGCLYDDGEWAELISLPKSEEKPKSLAGRYLKALINNPEHTTYKVGDYVKIKRERPQSVYEVTLDDSFEYGANPCKYPDKWQLMPEGFIPPTEEKINFSSKETEQKEWIPKVGEYIIFDEADILLVTEVLYDKYHDYWVKHTPVSFTGGGFGFKAYKDRIRKATSAEIPKEQVITNSSNPKFKIGDKVTVKDGKFDTLGDGWCNAPFTYYKVDGVAYDTGTVEKIIPTEKGIYYKLSCHKDGDVKEEMLDLVSAATEISKSEPKQEPEDFIVGGYIRLLRDYKGTPKGSVVMLTDITSDKRLAEFHSSHGDTCSLWTRYYCSNAECEWVGMINPEEMKGNNSIHEYPLTPGECYIGYNLETETDLLIKPKKETENKKTKFNEQEFLSNPFNKEFKISKVKTEKKKVVLNFN